MKAAVTIHLTGTNSLITKDNVCAGLQKDNKAPLIIKTNDLDTTAGILNARSIDGDGAGIGGGGAVLQRQRPGARGGCGFDAAVLRGKLCIQQNACNVGGETPQR